MKTKILLLFLFPLLWSCQKDNCYDPYNLHSMEVPLQISPLQENFVVGDTIRVIQDFSEVLYDRNTDRYFSLRDWNFLPVGIIHRIDGDSIPEQNMIDLADHTDEEVGFETRNYHQEIHYDLEYKDGRYFAAYEIVLLQEGTFVLSHSFVIQETEHNYTTEPSCKDMTVFFYHQLNEGDQEQQNIHLLEESPVSHYNDWVMEKPEERFYQFGSFAFQVNPR